MKILIVEDDRALNNGIALSLANHEILQAFSIKEADNKAAAYHFIIMPLIYSIAALALISALIPAVCYKRMCKKSIVNRLRVNE